MKKTAFTLAEIMIVLTVVGVLTAILLPVAYNAAPDEDVMKFKKANSTLATIIYELINSDKYFLDGDLGVRADGTLIDGEHDNDETYLCNAMANCITIKSINCSEYKDGVNGHVCLSWGWDTLAENLDSHCKDMQDSVGAEIIAADGTIFYQASPGTVFHYTGNLYDATETHNEYGKGAFYEKNSDGIGYRCAKNICFDIDGINEGEDPFGYALFVDGRIIPGKRATEWMEKSIQRGNND